VLALSSHASDTLVPSVKRHPMTWRAPSISPLNKANVTFDMLSEELRLCVGGVLANVSTDDRNRTRIYQLELKLASYGLQAAKSAAKAAAKAAHHAGPSSELSSELSVLSVDSGVPSGRFADIIEDQVHLALTEMPTTFEEHPDDVAARAYNSVLRDVLPGIRQGGY